MLHLKLGLTFAKDHSFLWAHPTPVARFNSGPQANWLESFPRPQPQASPEPEPTGVRQGVAEGWQVGHRPPQTEAQTDGYTRRRLDRIP